jgi:hypothetical protein
MLSLMRIYRPQEGGRTFQISRVFPEPTPKRTSAASAALVAAFAAVTAVLAWRSRGWPLVHDAPILHYIAWRLGEGAVPYRDLLDMNMPGTYLLHVAVLRGLGAGDVAWRVFDLGWLAGTSLLVAAVASPWGWTAAAGGALFYAAHHLAGGAWHAGQRDFLLCPFLVAGALAVARWLEGRAGNGTLLWGGLALGAGLTIKPHAALLTAALAAVVVAAAWRGGGAPAGPAAAFAGGVALVPAAVLGWLLVAGALGAWRDVVVDYLVPLYSRLGHPAHWTFYRWHVWLVIAVAVLGSLASAAWGRRLTARHGVAALGVGYGLLHFFGQGKGWEYHVYPLAAFAAVLLFSEVDTLFAGRHHARALPLAAVLLAVAGLLFVKGAEAADAGWIRDKTRRVSEVARDVAVLWAPGEPVQVLDTTEGGVHALLRLRAVQPTRFLYDFHFFHDETTPVVRAYRAELMDGLTARPPRVIVVFERGWPAGGYERVARFPELARYLAEAYRLAARGDGYRIYAKRDRP